MVKLPDLSLFVAMALFWATYWILRQTVFKPLGSILAERERSSAAASRGARKALDAREGDAGGDRPPADRGAARGDGRDGRGPDRGERAPSRRSSKRRGRKPVVKAADAQKSLDAEVAAAREQLRTEAHAMAAEIASRALGRKIA